MPCGVLLPWSVQEIEERARCEDGWVGIWHLREVPVTGDEVVGVRGTGKRDQVIVVWIGRDSDLGRRVVDERRRQPQSRNKRICLLSAEPATKPLASKYVGQLTQQLGADDQLEPLLSSGSEQLR